MQREIEKIFFMSEIIESDLVSPNCLYSEQDTSHRHPMRQQVVPRFCVSIRQTFSNSIDLEVFNQYVKFPFMKISTVFGHVYHVACRGVL